LKLGVIAGQLRCILNYESAEYKALVDDDLSRKWLDFHLNNKVIDYSNKILRAVTMEIYLKEIFSQGKKSTANN